MVMVVMMMVMMMMMMMMMMMLVSVMMLKTTMMMTMLMLSQRWCDNAVGRDDLTPCSDAGGDMILPLAGIRVGGDALQHCSAGVRLVTFQDYC